MAPVTRRGGSTGGRGATRATRDPVGVEPDVEMPSTEAATGDARQAETAAQMPPSTAGTPEVAAAGPSGDPVMMEILRSLQFLVADRVRGEAAPAAPVAETVRPAVQTAHALRDFLRLDPPTFHGEPDPVRAE